MASKKYYSISEVTKILAIHDYQLRYLEKVSPNFTVHKIRGRRYYTSKDISYLSNSLKQSAKNIPTPNPANIHLHEPDILSNMVDCLISKLYNLSIELKKIIANN